MDEMVSTEQVIDAEVIESTPLTEHQKFAAGLRELAAFYEARPELDLPTRTRFDIFPRDAYTNPVESAARISRLLGKFSKQTLADSYFMLRREFGSLIYLEANWSREKICERVVLGTEEVEEDVVVSQTTEKRKVTKEKVEWRCPKSVMAPKEVGDGA